MSVRNRTRRLPSAAVAAPAAPVRRSPWVARGVALGLALVAVGGSVWVAVASTGGPPDPFAGTVWIPPGEFVMGSADGPDNEQPAHRVTLDGFHMDAREVTNADFRRFVAATGYVTVAETPPDWDEMRKTLPPGTPMPPAETFVAGSLVFTPPGGPVPLDDVGGWWKWTPGASWRHPEGPGSDLAGRGDHPVVQVAWADATAYAEWAGKRLPTEAEWEYAARGGLPGKRFLWGDDAPTEADGRKANIWQGTFPNRNSKRDGFDRTAPAGSYPPNGFGLYDLAGNVWEWTADWYRADAYATRTGVTANPPGPAASLDPREPLVPKRVVRGGSFLCHVTYCESYRPAARRGTAADTGLSHTGFRCVVSAPEVRR